MVMVESTMMPLGSEAPRFALPEPATGRSISLESIAHGAKGTAVMFLCNHCPFVKHIAPSLAELSREFLARGVRFVGISSNDAKTHPDDAPDKMADEVKLRGYAFPYLFDADQAVAKAYRAACTPDLFLFDGKLRLYYRGQYDATRPKSGKPATGNDLRAAMESLLAGRPAPQTQVPSIGCNIKWTPGNEPDYFKP